jgi:hypothetical protein
MDMLEHFQDNVNLNSSNEVNFQNFLRTAQQVHSNLLEKFHIPKTPKPLGWVCLRIKKKYLNLTESKQRGRLSADVMKNNGRSLALEMKTRLV